MDTYFLLFRAPGDYDIDKGEIEPRSTRWSRYLRSMHMVVVWSTFFVVPCGPRHRRVLCISLNLLYTDTILLSV